MSKIKILIVEDEPNLGEILRDYLELKDYPTVLAVNGEEGLKRFLNNSFDFLILDVMMPRMDGFTLAKEIRSRNTKIPMLFLTAKSMKQDTIEGFKSGADDYMTKPFSMEELLLRINAIMRRIVEVRTAEEDAPKHFEVGKSSLNWDLLLFTTPLREIKLTARENDLLRLFCENINRTVDRSEALKKIWKDDSYFNARSMDVYIAKLRKYLKDDESLQILTIHGTGFKLVTLT
jgi:two-component system response regulator VicR